MVMRDTVHGSIQVVPWEQFIRQLRIRQGEHTAIIGPTGSGKTTLAGQLLPYRKYIVAFATKPRDENLEWLETHDDYKLIDRWNPALDPDLWPKRLLWPDASDLYSAQHQREVFQDAMSRIYRDGGWCIYMDELWYMSNALKLSHEVKTFLLQSRSNLISLLLLTQRPAHVPLEVYDQSTHLFWSRDGDEANLKRIGGISWISAKLIRETVANLRRFEWLYVNTTTGTMLITKPPKPAKGGSA